MPHQRQFRPRAPPPARPTETLREDPPSEEVSGTSSKDLSSVQQSLQEAEDDKSDAGTEVMDQADLAQQFDPNGLLSCSFWSTDPEAEPQDPGLALWAQDPAEEQKLVRTSHCEQWDSFFEQHHALLTQKAITSP